MTFKIWMEIYDNWVEINASTNFETGDGTFGYGQYSVVSLSGTSNLEPDINVDIGNIYVGQVVVGQTVLNNFQVFNTGNAPLHIVLSDDSPAFSTDIDNAVVPAFDSVTIAVTFDPPSAGGFTGELSIESNDPDEPLTIINLEGFALPSGESGINTSVDRLDFENTIIGSIKTLSFFVINTGTVPLTVNNISNTDAAFSVSPTSFTLQNTNDLKEIFVSFSPDARIAFSDVLDISSNAPVQEIELTGIGFGGV